MSARNVVVIGTQWGDEGKGKIVDWLTDRAQGVVRFQGGHNAGHTLVIGGEEDGAAPHPVGHPARRACSATSATAWCSRRRRWCRRWTSSRRPASRWRRGCASREACPLILPYHGALDHAREAAKGEQKIGTTGRGIGPAYEDKVARRAIRLQDLFKPVRFADKLQELLDFHNFVLVKFYKQPKIDFKKTLDETLALAPRLLPLVADVPRALYDAQPRRQEPAVRRRAGLAARHRPRHLSLRHLVQLRGGRGGGRRRHRPDAPALRAGHHQGLQHARRQRPVPDRAVRRRRRAAAPARPGVRRHHRAGRGAPAGSTPPRSSARSS